MRFSLAPAPTVTQRECRKKNLQKRCPLMNDPKEPQRIPENPRESWRIPENPGESRRIPESLTARTVSNEKAAEKRAGRKINDAAAVTLRRLMTRHDTE